MVFLLQLKASRPLCSVSAKPFWTALQPPDCPPGHPCHEPTKEKPHVYAHNVSRSVRLSFTATCLIVYVLASKSSWVKWGFDHRNVQTPFSSCGGILNLICDSSSYPYHLQRGIYLGAFPSTFLLSPRIHTLFSPNTDNYAPYSLHLHSRSDPTSTTSGRF